MTRPHETPEGWKKAARRGRKPAIAAAAAAGLAAITTTVGILVTKGWDKAGDGPAFTWTARLPSPDVCTPEAVVGRTPQEARPPDSIGDLPAWAAKVGAAPIANVTNVLVTLQGTSDTAVVLQGMHVKVLSSAATPERAFAVGNACGGEITPRMFEVTLDGPAPALQAEGGNAQVPGPSGEPSARPIPAMGFPYRISSTDPEVFVIKAVAPSGDRRWVIDLDWTSGGQEGTSRIDDHGRPFRTISMTGTPSYIYSYETKRWSLTGR